MGLFDSILNFFRGDSYGNAADPTRPPAGIAAGWANKQTGQGYAALDSSANTFFAAPRALSEMEIVNLYEGDGMAARIVDLPASEMLRQGFTVETGNESVDEAIKDGLAQIEYGPEGERGIEGALDQWLRWSALFGGAAILLVTDQSEMRVPLAPTEQLHSVRVLSRHSLTAPMVTSPNPLEDNASPFWTLNVSGREIHPSRLILHGRSSLPRRLRHRQGWSAPLYVTVWKALSSYGTIQATVPAIIQKFVTPVQKLKGLVRLLREGNLKDLLALLGQQQLIQSIHRVRVIDADGEDYQMQTTSVAGLADIMDRSPLGLSAATGIPVTLLVGRSPAGLNATGESDINFWYDNVKSKQGKVLAPAIKKIVRAMYPAALETCDVKFSPLRQMTRKQLAEIEKIEAETDKIRNESPDKGDSASSES